MQWKMSPVLQAPLLRACDRQAGRLEACLLQGGATAAQVHQAFWQRLMPATGEFRAANVAPGI